jgi:large subunit ribosomal protein L4
MATPSKTKKAVVKKATTKLSVLSLDGTKVGDVDMAWGVTATASPLLLAQVVHTAAQHAHIRRAHTKDRAEVRGGGKKPWKQKGTGRARHASIRSPIWVGGGTTFGPRSHHAHLFRLPAKMNQRALAAVVAEALREGLVMVVRIKDIPVKTRELVKLLPKDVRSLLMVTSPEHHLALSRVSANVPDVSVVSVAELQVSDVIYSRQIWLDEDAISMLKKRGTWRS